MNHEEKLSRADALVPAKLPKTGSRKATKLVSDVFRVLSENISIPIMSIGQIMKAGEQAIERGCSPVRPMAAEFDVLRVDGQQFFGSVGVAS